MLLELRGDIKESVSDNETEVKCSGLRCGIKRGWRAILSTEMFLCSLDEAYINLCNFMALIEFV